VGRHQGGGAAGSAARRLTMAPLEQLLSDLTSGDDARAEAAVPALTVHGPAVIKALLELLASPLEDHRWWSCRALAAFPQPQATAGLMQSLSDPKLAVRRCAALGLRQRPSPTAIEPLLSALAADDALLRRLAADALATVGPPAIPGLEHAANTGQPAVRIEAVRALAEMRHPDALSPLFRLIEDPSSMVQHWAEEGLERLGIGMAFFRP